MPNDRAGPYPQALGGAPTAAYLHDVGGGRRVKILVAEGNGLLADALGDLFAEANGGSPVRTARTVIETLESAASDAPDLVVIDHSIGRGDVEATIRSVLARSPRSRVVVITSNVDEAMASRLHAAGASQCVNKDQLHASAGSIVQSAGPR